MRSHERKRDAKAIGVTYIDFAMHTYTATAELQMTNQEGAVLSEGAAEIEVPF